MPKRSRFKLLKSIILPVLIAAAIFFAARYAFADAGDNAEQKQYEALMRRIDQAIVTCYAIEGYYPPTFEYLVKNYSINIDMTKYHVFYDVFASNIRPVVSIIPIISGGEAVG